MGAEDWTLECSSSSNASLVQICGACCTSLGNLLSTTIDIFNCMSFIVADFYVSYEHTYVCGKTMRNE